MSGSNPWTFQRFVSELGRRKVYRVAIGYLAIGWGLLEISVFVVERLGIPDVFLDIFLVLFLIGLRVSLVLSWTYDITSDGIVRTEPTTDTRKLSALQITQIGVIVFLLAALSYLIAERQAVETPPRIEDYSIGVLPFVNMSNDEENEYFSDGITEELLHALANVKDLRVASRTSSFYFKDKAIEISEAGRILGVATVLEGSVRKAGNQVRITAQLIDASDGYHLWSGTYDSQLRNIFAVQTEVTQQVVNAITPVLLRDTKLQAPTTVVDERAYDLYLQGRQRIREWESQADLEAARELFEQSIDEDPTFPLPFAGICDSNLVQYERNRDPQLFTGAEASCNRALVRMQGNAVWEIQVALAELYRLAGEYDKSLEALNQALAARGETPRLLRSKGMTQAAMGLDQQAETALQRAVDLDPRDWDSRTVLGNFHYDNQRYSRAISEYEVVLQLVPEHTSALIGLGNAQYMSGEEAAAEASWLQAEKAASARDAGALGNVYSNMGLSAYYKGDYDRAVKLQERATELRPTDHRPWGRLAESYRSLGNAYEEQAAYQKAIALAEDELRINPNEAESLGLLGIYSAFSGDTERAADYRERMLLVEPDNSTWLYFASLISLAMADIDGSFAYLEQAITAGLDTKFVATDPDLQRLRETNPERFAALASGPH